MFHICLQSLGFQVDTKAKIMYQKDLVLNRFNQLELIQMDKPLLALKNRRPA